MEFKLQRYSGTWRKISSRSALAIYERRGGGHTTQHRRVIPAAYTLTYTTEVAYYIRRAKEFRYRRGYPRAYMRTLVLVCVPGSTRHESLALSVLGFSVPCTYDMNYRVYHMAAKRRGSASASAVLLFAAALKEK